MEKTERLIALSVMVLILIGVFMGCLDKGKGSSTGESSDRINNNNLKQDDNKNKEQEEEEPYKFKIFINLWAYEVNDLSKQFIERMEKENNVEIEWEIPPTANYAERLQIMFAGGDYPEVINFVDHNDKILIEAVNDGVVIPITKYVDQAPNLMKYTYDASWEAVKIKEGSEDVYMIPRTSIARTDGYAVRKDWLENVGLSIPEDGKITLDELTEILRRFTHDDPDQNGKKDTYGMGRLSGDDGALNPLATNAFNILGWQKYENEEYPYMDLKFSRVSDNFKEALEYTSMLWKEGLIDPDWPVTKDWATVYEKAYRGTFGLFDSFAGHVQLREDQLKEINPEGEFSYIIGVKNEEGKVLGTSGILGLWGGFTLTKNASEPEKIIKTFDWILSDAAWDETKYGPEGITYNVEDGEKIPTPEYEKQSKSMTALLLRRNDDPSFFMSLNVPREERGTLEGWLDEAMNSFVFSQDLGYRPPISDEPGFIDAQNRLSQAISKIVVGELPVSGYDNALEDWYKSGGEEFVEQMNAHIEDR